MNCLNYLIVSEIEDVGRELVEKYENTISSLFPQTIQILSGKLNCILSIVLLIKRTIIPFLINIAAVSCIRRFSGAAIAEFSEPLRR